MIIVDDDIELFLIYYTKEFTEFECFREWLGYYGGVVDESTLGPHVSHAVTFNDDADYVFLKLKFKL